MRTAARGAAEHAKVVVWVCWLALVLNQMVESAITGAPLLIWLARLLPLLLFVPGMLRDRLRSFIWLSFVCLLYFISGVEKLFADPRDGLAVYGMVSVVGLFLSSALYVRWRARALQELAEQTPSEAVS